MIACRYSLDQRGQRCLRVGYDRHGGAFDFVHFRGVDIDMDEARVRREFAHLARHAIIEAQPDADDQVGRRR